MFIDRLRQLGPVTKYIGAGLFMAMFSGFIIQVFSRYVLNQPLGWTIEFIRITSIWTVFWCAAFLVPLRDHVSLDVIYAVLPPEAQRVLSIATLALGIGTFVVLLPALVDLIGFLGRRRTPVLHWPMNWVYGCYLIFIVGYIIQSFWQLRGLISRRWRDYLNGGSEP